MTTRFLVALTAGSALALLADRAAAHGGMYRGPADTVPPAPGGGGRTPGPAPGPTTGPSGGPSAPGRAPATTGGGRPVTGGGSPSGGATRGRTTGGVALEPDLTTWDYWWEFNKDAYLKLKDAVHATGPITGEDGWFTSRYRFAREQSLRPTAAQVREQVLPALRRAIDGTEQRDIASSCMVAMAKIGLDHPEFALVDVFKSRLRRPDQEIRETAALAIGIAARIDHGEVELLAGLARDDDVGRAAYGGSVDVRTRSFALHGLGLLAHEHADLAVKRAAFTTMRAVLDDERVAHRDLKVAAIHGIGLLDPGSATPADQRLTDDALACLADYFDRRLGAGERLIQAHCPTAIAKLVGRGAPSERWKQRFAAELRDGSDERRRNPDVARSCALALGQLCSPHEHAQSPDAAASDVLWQTWTDHRDEQTRRFAVVALGQIGGAANRTALLRARGRAQKATERPWVALSLGVLAFAQREQAARERRDVAEDHELGSALARELQQAKEPGLVGALAVALGLAHHGGAAPDMLARLQADPHKEDQAGYLALGLALMSDRASIEPLHRLVGSATRRPTLLKQTAVALGLLGDKHAARMLVEGLAQEQANLATFASLASALGLIGDRDSIEPLQQLLADEARGNLPRAFAAVALGGIADRARLPWYAKLAANLNYRAAVETLTNQQSGILDIL